MGHGKKASLICAVKILKLLTKSPIKYNFNERRNSMKFPKCYG